MAFRIDSYSLGSDSPDPVEVEWAVHGMVFVELFWDWGWKESENGSESFFILESYAIQDKVREFFVPWIEPNHSKAWDILRKNNKVMQKSGMNLAWEVKSKLITLELIKLNGESPSLCIYIPPITSRQCLTNTRQVIYHLRNQQLEKIVYIQWVKKIGLFPLFYNIF